MAKIVVLFFTLSAGIFVNAQTDTLNCKESFAHFDALLGENLIVIWEAPSSLKKCSQKDMSKLKEFAKEQTKYEYILVDMIIDSEGIPICFRFNREIESEIKAKFIDKLKLFRFNPALQKGKGVESIYTLKI